MYTYIVCLCILIQNKCKLNIYRDETTQWRKIDGNKKITGENIEKETEGVGQKREKSSAQVKKTQEGKKHSQVMNEKKYNFPHFIFYKLQFKLWSTWKKKVVQISWGKKKVKEEGEKLEKEKHNKIIAEDIECIEKLHVFSVFTSFRNNFCCYCFVSSATYTFSCFLKNIIRKCAGKKERMKRKRL